MNLEFTKNADNDVYDRFMRGGRPAASLEQCLLSLMRWRTPDGFDRPGTIMIGRDIYAGSFSFCEIRPDGKRGVNGGIIFHADYLEGKDGSMVPADDPRAGEFAIHT